MVFGLPGDGINGIMEALRKRQDKIRFIQVRHEESAAFMACGYAKFTGKLGVCLATSGPGGLHLLNGLYDAKLDGQPVLAITGMPYHDLIGTHTQQDVDLDKVFADVAVYNAPRHGADPRRERRATWPAARRWPTRGVRTSLSRSTCRIREIKRRALEAQRPAPHLRRAVAAARGCPHEGDLARAAEVLNAGKKVAILAGRGRSGRRRRAGAGGRDARRADRQGAARQGGGAGRQPLHDRRIGLLGTQPSQEAMETCDTLLMVGTSFPYIEFLPKPGQARGVQIDLDPTRIGLRYPVEVGLVGDSRRTLQALLPAARSARRTAASSRRRRQGMAEWWELMEERGTRPDKPMKPQVVAWELGKRLRDDAIVSCDSGTIATWWARQIPREARADALALRHAGHDGQRPALRHRRPDRLPRAAVRRLRRRRRLLDADGRVRHLREVPAAGQGGRHQEQHAGHDQVGADGLPGQPGVRLRAAADRLRGLRPGLRRRRLHHRGSRSAARCWTRRSPPGPVVVEAVVDPFEPPMPEGHREARRKFAQSLARGEPNREKIALTVLADKVRELGVTPTTSGPVPNAPAASAVRSSRTTKAHRW